MRKFWKRFRQKKILMKKILVNKLFIFYIYRKMVIKYCQNTKKKLQKEARERYQNFTEEEKEKR